MGPLFYTIFTNELPQVVHEQDCPNRDSVQASLFNIKYQQCGGLCCYADDSTYTVTGKDPAELSEKQSQNYNLMANFLTDNKLKVNYEKTHLIFMTTRQKRSKVDTTNMTIQTPTAVISQSTSERLLGAQIHQDMRWKEHLLDGKDALIKSLNKRQGAIKKLIKVASFKTLKSVADGIFMSKLTYLMPVWAGFEDYMVNSLQVVQNKVARTMTKQSRFTSTTKLMEDCQWLSTRQLMCSTASQDYKG